MNHIIFFFGTFRDGKMHLEGVYRWCFEEVWDFDEEFFAPFLFFNHPHSLRLFVPSHAISYQIYCGFFLVCQFFSLLTFPYVLGLVFHPHLLFLSLHNMMVQSHSTRSFILGWFHLCGLSTLLLSICYSTFCLFSFTLYAVQLSISVLVSDIFIFFFLAVGRSRSTTMLLGYWLSFLYSCFLCFSLYYILPVFVLHLWYGTCFRCDLSSAAAATNSFLLAFSYIPPRVPVAFSFSFLILSSQISL